MLTSAPPKTARTRVRIRPGAELTEDALRAFCTGKTATFKIPRYWKVVDEFPMTVTGKVQKYRMREVAIQELVLVAAKTAWPPLTIGRSSPSVRPSRHRR